MADKSEALKLAEELLSIGAVQLSLAAPYTWASGWKSPIYCDNRKILSCPALRRQVRDRFSGLIREKYANVQVIAGVATGGIAIGALVAEALDLPFVYVRSKQKAHGLANQIEGMQPKDKQVVVIEDLISTGTSSLNAVEALRSAGATVRAMLAIFSYEFDIAEKNIQEAGCALTTLSGYGALLEKALEKNYITKQQLNTLKKWRKDPEKWTP